MTPADLKRRARWQYEENTPRCSNCRNFQKARMPTPDTIQPARCRAGKFEVKPHGCCDKWVSPNGERLK
jgi:hypothetical protein